MLSMGKVFLVLVGILGFAGTSAASIGTEILQDNCKRLSDEVVKMALTPEFAAKLVSGDPDGTVLDEVLESALADLNEDQKFRLKPVFVQALLMECMVDQVLSASTDEVKKQALSEKQEMIEIKVAIARLQEALNLDPNKPGWGLVDIPEFDLSEVTCGSFQDEFNALEQHLKEAASKNRNAKPRSRRYNRLAPENDSFAIAMRKYITAYKADNIEEKLKIGRLGQQLGFQCYAKENHTRTLLDMLDEEARTLGLKKL